ncbi:RagB/SusD family nutrient uptake outer membrane protein [Flagellimonas crocea]|uniref:RagB/SusD family nutrient uptake outer membrane protein n=1 Tax=Flagellimonas crocea TaxID=3067311 RepID=UPI00296F28AD|nr:RagB/SusD family nutrient uptake outer membrane protein [Muricauda sp. DH64]
MKKLHIKQFLLGITAAFCLVGCTELEEQPEGLLAPESFFATEADYNAAAVGIYRNLYGNWSNFDFNNTFLMSGGSEDVTSRPPAANLKQYDEFNADPNNSLHVNVWRSLYRAINNANSLIANAESSELSNLDGAVGQAYFLRGMSYFYLTQWWGEVPIITIENQSDAANVGQSPVSDIYAVIISDLQNAESLLPNAFPEEGKADRWSASALLSKVYLTMAGWPLKDASGYALARDKAKEVIDSGAFSLESDFADLWRADNKFTSSEWIFLFAGSSTAGSSTGSKHHHATRPGSEGGWSDWFSEARFFNEFPDSYRKEISFHTEFADGTPWQDGQFGQPYIAKFRDAGGPCGFNDAPCGGGEGDGFTPIIRYADVMLIYAEAANMAGSGPTSEAYEMVNMIRRRANNQDIGSPDPAVDLAPGLSQAQFDEAVLAERKWELAFENNRWFDLVRKEMVVEVNEGLYPNVSENNRLLPKPGTEVELINGLEQNPGY